MSKSCLTEVASASDLMEGPPVSPPEPGHMRAAYTEKYGKLETVLKFATAESAIIPRPIPQEGEVLIEVRAVGVNPIDWKTANGDVEQLHPMKFPKVIGEDGAGVVVALGPKAGLRIKIGDEVYFCCGNTRQFGAFAEYCALPERIVALKPKNTSWAEAASLPLAALTSVQALRDKGRFKAGDKVFIQSGSGGVGSFAIQWAKASGASKIATTVSAANADFVKSLGANVAIDYKTQQFEKVLTGYDLALDTMGEDARRCFEVVREGGSVVTIGGMPDRETLVEEGMNAAGAALIGLWLQAGNQIRSKMTGIRFKFLFAKASGAVLDEVRTMVESAAIKPQVGRVYDSLEDAGAALIQLRDGPSVRGKIVILVKK